MSLPKLSITGGKQLCHKNKFSAFSGVVEHGGRG